ncbi:hypothetical protein GR212_29005 [Rhizobium lusitanum]|uniref:Monooxygenase n=1 Tax=Rhizobium lusitanum TaxID=293958 RepID=A0A6L9UHJ9_9HYPH|nr:YdhR family protein [Rhizobium lusitanum]NEI73596.1 hypothetical protein [Rhizobium lusitanum]
MGFVIAQVNYDSDFQDGVARPDKIKTAEKRTEIPGFLWKIWLRDENAKRGGGLFLFKDRPSAEAWLAARANQTFHSAYSNITVELFDVDEELSRVSQAPLDAAAA